MTTRPRKLIFHKTWDMRLEDWLERHPFIAALVFLPIAWASLALVMA